MQCPSTCILGATHRKGKPAIRMRALASSKLKENFRLVQLREKSCAPKNGKRTSLTTCDLYGLLCFVLRAIHEFGYSATLPMNARTLKEKLLRGESVFGTLVQHMIAPAIVPP